MRLKRPRPASLDEVRITREGKPAVIKYADPSVRVVLTSPRCNWLRPV